MNAPTKKPAPQINATTQPFWDAAKKRELRMQKCADCGHIRFPIGPVCTSCLSDKADWVKLSGRGTVLSHLVFHRAYSSAWKEHVPYSVAMVQLPEGPRMFTDIVDPERRYIDEDLVGRTVEVWFDLVEGDSVVPRFKVSES
ncbi:MAG: OB-fold domain-containing protein [Proteobacteria bacterium]|nr:OB-fold domain-containing protein [Pseudomonadota bacterium]